MIFNNNLYWIPAKYNGTTFLSGMSVLEERSTIKLHPPDGVDLSGECSKFFFPLNFLFRRICNGQLQFWKSARSPDNTCPFQFSFKGFEISTDLAYSGMNFSKFFLNDIIGIE